MLALAFLVPLVAGVYDLSVGAMMGLSLVILNWFGANQPDVPIALVAVMAIAVCAAGRAGLGDLGGEVQSQLA